MKLFGKYRNIREMLENETPKELAIKFPHGRPLSRRELLQAGAIQFAASFALPSLIQTLLTPSTANAASAACSSAPAFVGLKLNGGAGMLGNFVAKDVGRQLLPDNSPLGLGTGSEIANRMTTEFGGASFFDGSQMLAGIRQKASASTLATTSFVAIPVRSTDDNSNVPFDITYFVQRFGIVGSILPGLGTSQSLTGIQQLPALGKTPATPLPVTSVADISNALSVQGSLAALADSQKAALFGMIQKLSAQQAASIVNSTGGSVLGQLVNQANATNVQLVSGAPSGIDPLQDAAFSTRFNTLWAAGNTNLQNQTATTRERVFSSMVYNTLKGNAGTTNLDMGGYDYHNQTRPVQDAKDLTAGQVMGQIIESAAIMGKPVMLMVTSDGAVGAQAGSPAGSEFTSDRGIGGCIFLIAFHPLARPATLNNAGVTDFQVGQVAGQAAVDDTFLTGNDASLAGLAAFANFASFSGNLGAFTQIVGSTWNQDQINQVVRLRKVG